MIGYLNFLFLSPGLEKQEKTKDTNSLFTPKVQLYPDLFVFLKLQMLTFKRQNV
jgi:hypothetical protein